MAPVTPRRSTRASATRKRYTNDAFEGLNIEGTELMNGSSSDNEFRRGGDKSESSEAGATDDEYDIVEDSRNGVEDVDDAEDEMEDLDEDNNEDIRGLEEDHSNEAKPSHATQSHREGKQPVINKRFSRHDRLASILGKHQEDFAFFEKIVDKWGSDTPLPSRLADSSGKGGLSRSFSFEGEPGGKEDSEAWKWYYNGGQKAMARKQKKVQLTQELAQKFYPPRHKSHVVLMGPYGHQEKFEIGLGESLHLKDTWPPTEASAAEGERSTRKDGWLLNLGSRIRCLAWAPSIEGSAQYLAVSIHKNRPPLVPEHDAFHASEPWDSCIELWEFGVESGPEGTGYVSADHSPRLVHVICCSWGQVRQLKWCHIDRPPRDSEPSGTKDRLIGLLACVWSDGCVRALDVRIPRDHDPSKIYTHYTSAAFVVSNKKRICTALAWKSDKEILIGISSGEVGLFDISATILSRKQTPPEPTQFISTTPQSYPMIIISLSPLLPHYFCIATLSGQTVVVDLRDPLRGVIAAPRVRLPAAAMSFCPHLISMIIAEDELVAKRAIRWLGYSSKMMRMPSQVSCVSAGSAHASLLAGSVDGTATMVSTLGVFLAHKMIGEKLIWFKHEWVEKKGQEQDAGGGGEEAENSHMDIDGDEPTNVPTEIHSSQMPILRDGITRITEGFKSDTTDEKKAPVAKGKRERAQEYVPAVLYEEESAITQIEWNPNTYVGGWAAAGMGSGLLRVEDLAI